MGKKIVVVDDDRTLATTTAEVLREHGYEAWVAFDGYQALTITRQTRPDVIILDVMMPAGGGIKTFQNLRLSIDTANIPIIFATAVAPEEVMEKLGQTDIRNFVSKPYDVAALVALIEKLVGK
jgi:CheY-like chemotaxis protein